MVQAACEPQLAVTNHRHPVQPVDVEKVHSHRVVLDGKSVVGADTFAEKVERAAWARDRQILLATTRVG